MSEKVQNLFSDISKKYDFLNHVLSLNIDKSWRKKTISSIKSDKNSKIKVLDLCAGTLDLSIEFLKQFPQGKIISADFAHPMLVEGLNKILPQDKERIQIICADALNLPLAENSIDAIFCGFGYRNLDDQEAGLKEMKRVLKPGGQLLILEFFKPTTMMSRFFHSTYNNILMPTMGKFIANNKEAYEYLRDSISNFETIEETKTLMQNQNFKKVEIKHFLFRISSLISGVKS